ncbi:MAG TPA: chorismate mutase, partial [Planctomycetota bacterium]|nr:chorismate mutase [Planctomycetota bacterium]
MCLDELRSKIDQLDEQIVRLINERALITREIGEIKRQSNSPVY